MPKVDYKKSNFDLDLKFGEMGEDYILRVFESGNKVEVKTERDIWKKTGNIAIEIRFKGRKSGLSITDAETWCHILTYNGKVVGTIVVPVEFLKKRVKKLIKNKKAKIKFAGDNEESQVVLLPIKYIWEDI
mgnify:CR=1 FL=1|tara:strand:+ start:4479 stop:4871 length:393 start_codon:yes stop_codon:yes gene_type:complete